MTVPAGRYLERWRRMLADAVTGVGTGTTPTMFSPVRDGKGMRNQAKATLPRPQSAITQPIGQGVPSANAPTSAEAAMPNAYWIEPTRADTAPACRGSSWR